MSAELMTQSMVGYFLLVWGVMAFARHSQFMDLLNDFKEHPGILMLAGLVTFLLGSYILHTHCRMDDAASIIVTVVGWACAAKGAMLLCFPKFWMNLVPSEATINKLVKLDAPLLVLAGGYILWHINF